MFSPFLSFPKSTPAAVALPLLDACVDRVDWDRVATDLSIPADASVAVFFGHPPSLHHDLFSFEPDLADGPLLCSAWHPSYVLPMLVALALAAFPISCLDHSSLLCMRNHHGSLLLA